MTVTNYKLLRFLELTLFKKYLLSSTWMKEIIGDGGGGLSPIPKLHYKPRWSRSYAKTEQCFANHSFYTEAIEPCALQL